MDHPAVAITVVAPIDTSAPAKTATHGVMVYCHKELSREQGWARGCEHLEPLFRSFPTNGVEIVWKPGQQGKSGALSGAQATSTVDTKTKSQTTVTKIHYSTIAPTCTRHVYKHQHARFQTFGHSMKRRCKALIHNHIKHFQAGTRGGLGACCCSRRAGTCSLASTACTHSMHSMACTAGLLRNDHWQANHAHHVLHSTIATCPMPSKQIPNIRT